MELEKSRVDLNNDRIWRQLHEREVKLGKEMEEKVKKDALDTLAYVG